MINPIEFGKKVLAAYLNVNKEEIEVTRDYTLKYDGFYFDVLNIEEANDRVSNFAYDVLQDLKYDTPQELICYIDSESFICDFVDSTGIEDFIDGEWFSFKDNSVEDSVEEDYFIIRDY